MKNVTKFVAWEVPELDELKECRAYKAMAKLNNGGKLTREEKDGLQNAFNWYGCAVKLYGWLFDFTPYLHKYLVHHKVYGWSMQYGFDRTAIRNSAVVKSHVLEIRDY